MYIRTDFYLTWYPSFEAYLMRPLSSSSLMNPSPLASAWRSPRKARRLGIRAPRLLKALFSSALLRRPSRLTSCCLKISLNCSSLSVPCTPLVAIRTMLSKTQAAGTCGSDGRPVATAVPIIQVFIYKLQSPGPGLYRPYNCRNYCFPTHTCMQFIPTGIPPKHEKMKNTFACVWSVWLCNHVQLDIFWSSGF